MEDAASKMLRAIGPLLLCATMAACSPFDSDQDSISSVAMPARYIVKFRQNTEAMEILQGSKASVDLLLPQGVVAARIPARVLEELYNHPDIEYIEPDDLVYMHAESVPYGITMVRADQTPVPARIDPNGKRVCVIDSGIMASHEDLQTSNIDGVSLIRGEPYNTETQGHGTHVAGTIAAIGGNGLGVVGVLPNGVDLYIVKVFPNGGGSAYTSTILQAFNTCVSVGAKVVNMSLGGGRVNKTAGKTYADAYENEGMLIIASAGNDGNSRLGYPASYPSVISVAAIDEDKTKANFSQYNSEVELAAPGVDVRSTVPFAEVVKVDGVTYNAKHLRGAVRGVVKAPLTDGRRCATTGPWSGKVVLCQRGDITFVEKVKNVQASGGVAAVIYNNKPGLFSGTLGDRASSSIPVLAMSLQDGAYLAANKFSAMGEVVSDIGVSGYASWGGTSMAAPHVTGVAALVWSKFPDKTNKEIREALASSAEDLGRPGRDSYYGYGLVQAQAAIAHLARASSGGTYCGNNIKDGSEVCDGDDLGGETCTSLGERHGTLACKLDCGGYDTTGCAPSVGGP